jgi:ribonucleoside-diphosphate reductase alpha chain
MEAISYFAILASSELARERGRYPSYAGSKWDRGMLPIDTLNLLEEQRGVPVPVDRAVALDWQPVRDAVAQYGMRNSNILAIAPTATISTIIGVSQSIEPAYKYLYVKSNLSGEFTQVSDVLVAALKERHLWDANMLEEIKYYDGSLQNIGRIPLALREQFLTAFEIDPKWLIECAARRQKWIDQAQSLNLYMAEPGGRKIDELYKMAWSKGLKTTYYLRTISATYAEKSTVDTGALNAVYNKAGTPRAAESTGSSSIKSKLQPSASSEQKSAPQSSEFELPLNGQVCDPNDTECEACQ